MEEEALDWGNEEDELPAGHFQGEGREDAEDAVSLGGDDDDNQDFPAYQSRPVQDTELTESTSAHHSQHQLEPPTRQNSQDRDPFYSASKAESPQQHRRSQSLSFGKLTHALPPKPILVPPDYVRPAPPQASTLAGPMVSRERRPNGHSKADGHSFDSGDSLPPDWELRFPRNGGRDAYYYNVKSHESTWTRPGAVSGGRSSPSKERDLASARSPRSGAPDYSARSQTSDRLAPTRARRERRRTSPADGMSFDDRHYRPGEPAVPALTADDRGGARSRARQLSPSGVDARRPRSLTPPRREPERLGHVRGRLSRSPSPVTHGTWRDAPQSRLSQTPERERGWARARNELPVEDVRSASPDSRAPRGRRHRADLSPPRHPSHTQDQNDRFNDSREWSSAPHRHRSPPRDNDNLPKPKRNAPTWDSWEASPPPPNRNRPASPPTPEKASMRQRDDVYIPPDLIPQRRGRELVSPERGPEVDAKRRRVDDRLTESLPVRRAPPVDQGIPPPVSLPERPMSDLSLTEPEAPRRKRAPLPPQSARFREASKMPAPTPAVPPPQVVTPNTGPSHAPSRPTLDGPPPRTSVHSYADVPSGPRHFAMQPAARDSDGGRLPPTKPSGRRSRFDPAPQPQQPPLHSGPPAHGDRDAMDVDYPSSSRPPLSRAEEPATRSTNMYPNRPLPANDLPTETPRGPKAMTGRINTVPPGNVNTQTPPAPSPSTPFSNMRSQTEPVSAPAKMRGRAAPPHMVQTQDGWASRRSGEPLPPPRVPMGNTPDVRRYDEQRDYSADVTPSRRPELGPKESRPPGGRDAFRSPETLPPPRQKLSESNSTPVSARRPLPNGPSSESTNPARSPVEQYRPLPAQEHHTRYDQGPTRYQDELPLINRPSPRESPTTHYRPLLPLDRRQPLPSSLPPPLFQEPVLETMVPPRPRRDSVHTQSDRPPRQLTEPAESQPRVWMTREESQRLERATLDGHRPVNPPPSSHEASLSSRNASMDIDDPPTRHHEKSNRALGVEATTPPRPSDDRHYDRPSLEGRLSSHYDSTAVANDQYRTVPPPQPPRGRGKSDIYHDDHSRADYKADREGHRGPRDDHAPAPHQSWEHSAETSSSAASRLHPDRARYVEPKQGEPYPAPEPDSSKISKGPIRIRRAPKSTAPEEVVESHRTSAHGNGHVRDGDPRDSERPPIKRGGSLLDRLSLDTPSVGPSAGPSLRDRVDVPIKRPMEDIPSLPPKPMVGASGDVDSGAGDSGGRDGGGRGSGGGRGKKRNGKSRRGRKGGAA